MDSNIRPETMERISTPALANAFIDEQVKAIRFVQERYAWFLDELFSKAVFEKKKGQRKLPLAEHILQAHLEPFISGVSLGADREVDAPQVKTQYMLKGMYCTEPEIVERMYFDGLLDFVYVEFMKGLQREWPPETCPGAAPTADGGSYKSRE